MTLTPSALCFQTESTQLTFNANSTNQSARLTSLASVNEKYDAALGAA